MILRPRYIDALRTYRNIPLVKILAGIRRCGKSTILEMLRDDLLAGGVFTEDALNSYIELKEEECSLIRDTPHPAEFSLYYSL